MKFEVRHPNGTPHEVELEGTVAVLGRDPSCDLVLSDVKCSRRHAVVEAGPQGISIRDAGSANGTYLNGKKIERASLKQGDVIRMGDVQITVLAEEIPGTVVMGPEDMPDIGPEDVELEPLTASTPETPSDALTRPPESARTMPSVPPPAPAPPTPPLRPSAPRPPAAPPVPRVAPSTPPPPPRPASTAVSPPRPAAAERPRISRPDPGRMIPIPRPLTVTVIGVLWACSSLAYAVGGLLSVALGKYTGLPAILILVATFVFTIVSGLMAFGMLTLSRWARVLQIATALPGLLICPFAVGTASIIAYMFRPEARIYFSGRHSFNELSEDEAALIRKGAPEGLFTAAVLGGFFLGVLLSGIAAIAIPYLIGPRP